MTTFDETDLPVIGDDVTVAGATGKVVKCLRTQNGVRVTVDIPDVTDVDASAVDASTIEKTPVRTTGSV